MSSKCFVIRFIKFSQACFFFQGPKLKTNQKSGPGPQPKFSKVLKVSSILKVLVFSRTYGPGCKPMFCKRLVTKNIYIYIILEDFLFCKCLTSSNKFQNFQIFLKRKNPLLVCKEFLAIPCSLLFNSRFVLKNRLVPRARFVTSFKWSKVWPGPNNEEGFKLLKCLRFCQNNSGLGPNPKVSKV